MASQCRMRAPKSLRTDVGDLFRVDAKAEGELLDRGQLIVDQSTSDAPLRIKNIRTSDEGEYKCEITFLDITKNCPVVQLVKLSTLGTLVLTNT